jgi:hypothetical protein
MRVPVIPYIQFGIFRAAVGGRVRGDLGRWQSSGFHDIGAAASKRTRHYTSRVMRRSLVFILSVMCTLSLMAGSAQAATGSQSFRFVFTADPHSGLPGRVVASGLVKGIGTDTTIATQENPDGSETDTDLITLPGGTITIVDTDPADIFHFDPATCVARISGTGPFSVAGGTGDYAGATGSGTFTANGIVIFSRTDGGCSEEPEVFFASVRATGNLTFPKL